MASRSAHRDDAVRQYWIEHGIACRRIAAEMRAGSSARRAVTNFWIPDGSRMCRSTARLRASGSRHRWMRSSPSRSIPTLQSRRRGIKLFGIGSESLRRRLARVLPRLRDHAKKLYCLDAGHFHPTEIARRQNLVVLQFVPGMLLHVSRGVRWDSDHVVLLDDPTARHHGGNGARRFPRPHPHRPRLFRRQHQPHRRVGHRHAQRAQGAAPRTARADRDAARRGRGRFHRAPRLLEEAEDAALRRGLGRASAARTACRSARRG